MTKHIQHFYVWHSKKKLRLLESNIGHSTWQSHNSSQVNPRWKGCRPHRRPGINKNDSWWIPSTKDTKDGFYLNWSGAKCFFLKFTSFSYFWLTMFKLLRKIKLEHMLSFNCVIGSSFKPLKSWGVWIDVWCFHESCAEKHSIVAGGGFGFQSLNTNVKI